MSWRGHVYIICVVLIVPFAISLTYTLTNGTELTGKLLRQDKYVIHLLTQQGCIRVLRKEIIHTALTPAESNNPAMCWANDPNNAIEARIQSHSAQRDAGTQTYAQWARKQMLEKEQQRTKKSADQKSPLIATIINLFTNSRN